MRVALNNWDVRAGLRGHVQFYKHTHTHIDRQKQNQRNNTDTVLYNITLW